MALILHWPDLINGLFELFGGLVSCMNVKQLLADKKVRGVRIMPTVLFSAWGFWNLFYYPHLGQWLSFIGGAVIVGANVFWTGLAWRYRNV